MKSFCGVVNADDVRVAWLHTFVNYMGNVPTKGSVLKRFHQTIVAVSACASLSACSFWIGPGNGPGKAKIDYSRATGVKVDQRAAPVLPCDFQKPDDRTVCAVNVPIILVKDGAGQVTCVALFPEVLKVGKSDSSKPNQKSIVWNLVPPGPLLAGGPTFTFFEGSDPPYATTVPAIFILNDTAHQIEDVGLGDGTDTAVDKTKYEVVNKLSRPGIATYLPIVVRTDHPDTAKRKVSMCATSDPIIWND